MAERTWIGLLCLAILTLGCPEPTERMPGLTDHIPFDEPEQYVFVSRPSAGGGHGLARLYLHSGQVEPILESAHGCVDMSDDEGVLVLRDQDTNLHLVDREGSRVRSVPAAEARAWAVALTRDGRRLAFARHADYEQPQARWPETTDSDIHLVDVESLESTTLEGVPGAWVLDLRWAAGEEHLLARVRAPEGGEVLERIAVDGGERRTVSETDDGGGPATRQARIIDPHRCEGVELVGAGSEGIAVRQGGEERRVVTVEIEEPFLARILPGCRRPTIGTAVLTSGCGFVVFDAALGGDQGVYLADLESGGVARVGEGWLAFPTTVIATTGER